MSERFEMRVSEEWLAKVDRARGLASRAAFVKAAVEVQLARGWEARGVDPITDMVKRRIPPTAGPRAVASEDAAAFARGVEKSQEPPEEIPLPKIAGRRWA